MDMYKILKNFDDASNGKKPSSAKGDANSMKAILESLDKVTAVEECGMPMSGPAAPMQQGTPVSMNVSLNASGKDNVDELMALLKGAGLTAEPKMGPSEPMDMGAMRALVMDPADDDEMDSDIEIEKEEWDNSPEEEYSDHETMTKDLSGGINRQKKMFKPAAKGDNPMAVESVKERLWAALNEKKTTEGKYKSDAQRKAIHANKDKKKTNEADWNTMAALARLQMQHDAEKKYRDSTRKSDKSKDDLGSLARLGDPETIAGLTRLKMQHDAEKKYRDSTRKSAKSKNDMGDLAGKFDQETLAGLTRLKMQHDAEKKYRDRVRKKK